MELSSRSISCLEVVSILIFGEVESMFPSEFYLQYFDLQRYLRCGVEQEWVTQRAPLPDQNSKCGLTKPVTFDIYVYMCIHK